MKFLWIGLFLVTSAFANQQNLSTVKSIDDLALPPIQTEPSEEALPLKSLLDEDFTVVSEARVNELFATLEADSRARNKIAGGKCAIRRAYIQNYLKKQNIISGKFLVQCPSYRGHMKLIDQVTGRRYTFANFHDVNIVATPKDYKILDVQFASEPLSFKVYLALIEASQKIKPQNARTNRDKGYCYWSIK
ncbi:MAG: hypothetical protein V4598_06390 [Bdellovibrionota bacterium]